MRAAAGTPRQDFVESTVEDPGTARRQEPRIAVVVNVAVAAVFIVAAASSVALVRNSLRREALREAAEKAEIILDRNLATHHYFSHQLKPSVFTLSDNLRPPGYFEPRWMSSTYAIREIDREFRRLTTGGYYYKECAVDARSPENEADAFEREFIERLNRDPTLERQSAHRVIDGAPFLAVLRRGELMERDCLRCHSDVRSAPAGLLDRYGTERSFNRSVGEVVSAISIRIPLSEAYAQSNRAVLRLSAVLLAMLGGLLAAQVLLGRRLVFGPLERLQRKIAEVASDDARLGDQVDPPAGRELAALARTFNSMSAALRRERDGLEETIRARTEVLSRTNEDLRAALEDVRQLRGLLPICASCKRIRDAQGRWTSVESYLATHSGAVFTHGLCDRCAPLFNPGGEGG